LRIGMKASAKALWRLHDKRLAIALAMLLLCPAQARASFETDLLDRWYILLGQANESGLAGLLSPRATIRLNDIGVTQTRSEFLDSMKEWRAAIKGGNIRYRIETTSAGAAIALVCYEFRSNDLMTRESFRIAQGLITRSEQTTIAEGCRKF